MQEEKESKGKFLGTKQRHMKWFYKISELTRLHSFISTLRMRGINGEDNKTVKLWPTLGTP